MTSQRRTALAQELRGYLLLAVIIGLVALSIAIYNKDFSDDLRVEAVVSRTGLQLNPNGDVRLRGALVGRIVTVEPRGGNAVIHMAIDPAAATDIPSNVTVAMRPTTLFGQKYVELIDPMHPSGRPLADGETLTAAHNAAPLEVGTVLDHLEPVLTAVQPQKLSVTLAAIADGLQGRGTRLGHLIHDTKGVIASFNAQLPQLISDLRALATLTGHYADITPAVLDTLANATVTSRTLVRYQTALAELLTATTAFADVTSGLLGSSFTSLVDSVLSARPVLDILARYSPEYACIFRGLDVAQPAVERTVRDGRLHVHLILGAQQNGYTSKDSPRYGDVGRGPSCANLPDPVGSQPAFTSAHDGVGGR